MTRSNTIRVYLASSAENRAFVQILEAFLASRFDRVEFVGDWYRTAPIASVVRRAELDFSAIDRSDIVIAVYPYGPGTTSEIGYSVASGKSVIYHSSVWDSDEDPLVVGLARHRDGFTVTRTTDELVQTLNTLHARLAA